MISRKVLTACAAAALSILAAATAVAHHSAAQFDFGHAVTVTGKLTYVRFANPHAKIKMEVTDERGTREIEFEGHSRNNMIREGLTPDLFHVGDVVTLKIAPMRDGSDGGYVTALMTEDGQAVGNITKAD